jgi:hypothetical protein
VVVLVLVVLVPHQVVMRVQVVVQPNPSLEEPRKNDELGMDGLHLFLGELSHLRDHHHQQRQQHMNLYVAKSQYIRLLQLLYYHIQVNDQ